MIEQLKDIEKMGQMNFYQQAALKTRLPSANYKYLLLNLAAEVGELLSLEAKATRDGVKVGHFENVEKELGDILWHVAMIAYDNDLKLNDIADLNLAKLYKRQMNGTLQGNGDNR